MGYYLAFLLLAMVQWILLFPDGNIDLGESVCIEQKKRFTVLLCAEIIVFTGFRAKTVGADIIPYLRALSYYRDLPKNEILQAKLVWPFDFEVGYFMLTKLSAWMNLTDTQFLFVVSVLIYVPVFMFIYSNSDNPWISLLVYFAFGIFEYSLGIFRQMIATGIILMGSRYIKENKFWKYLICVGIAMTFHTTSLIVLPMYWIAKVNLKGKLELIFIVEAIIFVIARILVIALTVVFPKYASYIGGKYDVQGGSYTMLLFFNVIMVVGYCLFYDPKFEYTKEYQISFNAIVIACFLQIMGYYMGLFGRVIPYYSIYLLILIPIIIKNYFRKDQWIIHAAASIALIGVFWLMTYKNEYILPFSFVWM